MKIELINAILSLAATISIYLIFSFALWNLNPETWSFGERLSLSLFAPLAGIMTWAFSEIRQDRRK